MDATVPGGWEGLHLVGAGIRLDGEEVERVTYDIEDAQIAIGSSRIVAGTGDALEGEYVRVSAADVIVTTGGAHLSVTLTTHVVRALGPGTSFELSVTDDAGETTSIVRSLAAPPDADEGLTLGTVVTAVLVALLAGGFVGNLFASRRRPPPRLSVYGTIQRRIDEERTAAP
jgi:hypothetical protein